MVGIYLGIWPYENVVYPQHDKFFIGKMMINQQMYIPLSKMATHDVWYTNQKYNYDPIMITDPGQTICICKPDD